MKKKTKNNPQERLQFTLVANVKPNSLVVLFIYFLEDNAEHHTQSILLHSDEDNKDGLTNMTSNESQA